MEIIIEMIREDSYSGASTSYFGPGSTWGCYVNGVFTAGAAQDQWIIPDYESLFMGS